MKIAAKIMLSLTYAAQFGTGGLGIFTKPKPCQLELDGKQREARQVAVASKIKKITNACSWLDD